MKTRVYMSKNLIIYAAFILTLVSCNKSDYYQKEFLNNPYQEDPKTQGPGLPSNQEENYPGEDNGNQGGEVDGGVGGTNGGSTDVPPSTNGNGGESDTSTGGTDGSVAGGGSSNSGDGQEDQDESGDDSSSNDSSSTDSSTTVSGTLGDCNQGHGNDLSGVDNSNPTIGLEEKCKLDTFYQSSNQTKKLDILWVIDNSGSMEDEQDSLAQNFHSFIADFITKNVDFKMAITTTDGTLRNSGKIVSNSDELLTSLKAQENAISFIDNFSRLVKVGTSGPGDEKGLEAIKGFVQRYQNTFFRSDAYLAVVIVSDEEDQSSLQTSAYVDLLKGIKQDSGLIKVYSIVDKELTNNGSGITTGFQRYAALSDQTSGLVMNIREDFHQNLSLMGDSLIILLDSFALRHVPLIQTIRVIVNGVEKQNYSYDVNTNSIKFNAGDLPPVGAEIKVSYEKL